jgi:hypothetical protein
MYNTTHYCSKVPEYFLHQPGELRKKTAEIIILCATLPTNSDIIELNLGKLNIPDSMHMYNTIAGNSQTIFYINQGD